MKQPPPNDTEAFGSDSFLDVVANMVGMLIILVMVVGVRAGRSSFEADARNSAAKSLAGEVAALESEATTLEQETLRLAALAESVGRETLHRGHQRAALAVLVAAAENELTKRRAALDTRAQRDFDLDRALIASRAEAERLERDLVAANSSAQKPTEILTDPTPLSKPVDGREAQFQLRRGRITFIPIDKLTRALRSDARRKAHRLRTERELTDTVGPIGGFRLRYTMERVDIPLETQLRTGRVDSYARLADYELIPVASDLGETTAEALESRSQFRAALTTLDPKRTTVTIWTYPESFADFRKLKAALHGLGFSTAGRPLPDGEPIGGSPRGSRSAAE